MFRQTVGNEKVGSISMSLIGWPEYTALYQAYVGSHCMRM